MLLGRHRTSRVTIFIGTRRVVGMVFESGLLEMLFAPIHEALAPATATPPLPPAGIGAVVTAAPLTTLEEPDVARVATVLVEHGGAASRWYQSACCRGLVAFILAAVEASTTDSDYAEERRALMTADKAARLSADLQVVTAAYHPTYLSHTGEWIPGVSAHAKAAVEANRALSVDIAEEFIDDSRITSRVLHDSPAGALLKAGKGATQVVVGHRGRGAARSTLLGSVSAAVVTHADSTVVVVVRDHGSMPVAERPAVVGVDGSESCGTAIRYAAAFAARHDAPLHVVAAWQQPDVPGWGALMYQEAHVLEEWKPWMASQADKLAPAAAHSAGIDHPSLTASTQTTSDDPVRPGAQWPWPDDHSAAPATLGPARVDSSGKQERADSTMTRISLGSIVVGVDGSAPSTAALHWAIEEAARRSHPLHLVHAWGVEYGLTAEPFGPPADDELLQTARDTVARRAPELEVTTTSAHTFPASTLIALSERAHTIVVGSRGRGAVGSAVLGSVALTVVMHAACPVAVVRGATTTHPHSPAIVGVDGSDLSHHAVECAFEQAASREVPLIALHAFDLQTVHRSGAPAPRRQWASLEKQNKAMLDTALEPARARHPQVTVHARFVHDYPSRALLEAAQSTAAQLLVVGSRGRGGFRGMLLGSVSQRLIQQAPCPVLIVRPERT